MIIIFECAALQVNAEAPTEAECKPHIEKALHTLKGDRIGKKFPVDEHIFSFDV